MLFCTIIFGFLGIFFAYQIKKFFTPPQTRPKPPIHKKDFRKDTVYLYQFRRLKNCPNMSPFCMKIEILCRIYNIPYEIIETANLRSRSGTLPFIELNGEHISDSDLIELTIKKQFKIEPLHSTHEEAQSVAISRLADNHLFHILMQYHCADDIFYRTFLELLDFQKSVIPFVLPIMKVLIGKKIHSNSTQAIGDFDENELKMLLFRDLTVIEEMLAGKSFLFGEKITSADATVFGQLAAVYYPFRTEITKVLEDDFPKVLEYMVRVRRQVYPNDFCV